MTGSSLPCRASSVRSRPKLSRAGVLLLPLGRSTRRRHRCGRGRLPAAMPARSPALVLHAVAEKIEHLLADVFELEAEVHEHLGRHALLLAEQAQEDVLGADVVMVEVAGLFHRVLDDLLGAGRLRELAHRHHVRAALDELLDFHADLPQVDVEVLEHVGGDAAPLLDEAEENVLGADVLVVEPLGLLVGQLHHLASPVCKTLVHEEVPSSLGRTATCQTGKPPPSVLCQRKPYAKPGAGL